MLNLLASAENVVTVRVSRTMAAFGLCMACAVTGGV